jgi:6-pyruvoyltetrahydropterin/6-carboxytetrahydropterin synthase
MKRAKGTIDGLNPKAWMDYMFDHTMIIAEDDPFIESFRLMGQAGAAQVRILPAVGAEKFAEYIYNKLQAFVSEETGGRVSVAQVEFMEHGKNSALYKG